MNRYNVSTDWQLRMVDRDGRGLWGAAVVVSPKHAITCAHVVNSAVRADGGSDAGPGSTVHLRRPGHPEVITGTVLEDGWWWEDRAPWDVAVLRLDPAPGVRPVSFNRVGAFRARGERVSVSGFVNAEHGRWATARLRRRGGPRSEYVQFDTEPGSVVRIEGGFSGGGVIEPHDNELLGIVCAASSEGRVGWMIPTEEIPPVWRPGPGPGPPKVGPVRPDLIHRLSLFAAELDTISSPVARRAFHRALDQRLRSRIPSDQPDQLYAEELVLRAHRDFGILQEVLDQLDMREDGGVRMRAVWDAARPLLGEEE
ncbi:MAG: trypsin-like peptidase domain-containing protein [Nocardiopsis sp. BM-2018]|uniref:Serine protease n=1 Tax=Nocardiopsis metallicus TaxID=179819 RepID=A0A840WQX8_9ACTN|nr:trypsin-like peptidase domain-containing protein [Nocardiopsis metallicus]MBB5494265.1 hypothetical protein [Nocardiopsis metallicus]QRN81377.1 MAG: trypsin-like peptidase domain-containing protein [Nocardiopsis sp. BM-2018]